MMVATDAVAVLAREEILGGVPIADAAHMESSADDLWREAGTNDLEQLAKAAGARLVLVRDLPDCAEGMTTGHTIYVRRRRDERRTYTVGLHEIAHRIYDRARIAHSHADVWCLTLALGAPRSMLRALGHAPTLADLFAATLLPRWAVFARLEMPLALAA